MDCTDASTVATFCNSLAWVVRGHAELSNGLFLPCRRFASANRTLRQTLVCFAVSNSRNKESCFFCFCRAQYDKSTARATRTLVTFRITYNQILPTNSECFCWPKRPEIWAVERTPFLVCKFVICLLDNLIEQLQLANRHWSNTLIAIKRLRCMLNLL